MYSLSLESSSRASDIVAWGDYRRWENWKVYVVDYDNRGCVVTN